MLDTQLAMPTVAHKIHRPDTAVSNSLAPFNIIRTETVLSRLPIHNLSKNGKIDIQITRKNAHGEVDLLWDVTYTDRYGQPRQLAYKLDTLIINRRIDELRKPLPKVIRIDGLKQICRIFKLHTSGKNTRDLKKAFHQNAGAYITAKLHYKTKDGTEKDLEAGFNRYSVVFTGERLPNGTKADAVYLVLNDVYLDVLNNAPIRPLDYDYLDALQPSAQRFYEVVSFKIYAAIKYRHRHAKLAYSEYCIFSAQQRYYDYDHFKKQMYKVHKPHLQSGYIDKVSYEATTDDDGKPDWLMCYIPGPKARAEFRTFNGKHAKGADILDQESVLAIETSEASPRDDARDLVAYFHRRFHDDETATPEAKDLEFAASLITQHGMEKSRFIVEYSKGAADATKYSPDMLIGIRKYVSVALKTFEAQEKNRQLEKNKEREAKLEDRYRAYKNTKIQEIESTLSAQECDDLKAAIREQLRAENTDPTVLGLGVQLQLDAELAERAGVPPYEEWRKQQE
jgi:hypothetical protein